MLPANGRLKEVEGVNVKELFSGNKDGNACGEGKMHTYKRKS